MRELSEIARLEEKYFSDAWSEKSLEETFDYDVNQLFDDDDFLEKK